MTKARLLAEADSLELSQWQQFFEADAALQEDRQKSAALERSLDQG